MSNIDEMQEVFMDELKDELGAVIIGDSEVDVIDLWRQHMPIDFKRQFHAWQDQFYFCEVCGFYSKVCADTINHCPLDRLESIYDMNFLGEEHNAI